MLRQEAKAQGLSPTLNSEWMVPIVCKSQGKEQTKIVCWALSPTLSSATLLGCSSHPGMWLQTHKKPCEHYMEIKAGSSAQHQLCLWLQWLSSRVTSNVSDKRPSANPPERLALWHHWCAQFCSVEPPSAVALLPKTRLRSQSNSTDLHKGLHAVAVNHGMITTHLQQSKKWAVWKYVHL